MKVLRYFLILCIAVVSGTLHAQSQEELGQLMRERGEYYFTISLQDPSQLQELSMVCSVDGVKGQTVVAYANQEEYDKLLSLGYNPVLETPPSMRANVTMWNGQGTYNWDSYLTYDQYVTMMQGFPSSVTNGASCTLLDLGELSTSAHRHLLGVRLNNGSPEGKPRFLYTSTMHGDEITGMILMLRLINEFCTSDDSRILNILNNVDLFIFPDTNPDGTYKGGNSTVNSAQRYNGNNIDLNRHFADFDDGAHPDATSYYVYQDEAQWMMDLAQQYLFTMGANYHGGAEVMNYPWDTYQPVHPDDAWWRYVSAEYVSNARSVYSSYMTDTYSSGITNGYAWYTITGSRQDYMNYYGQCREVTVECSTDKTPDASELPKFWNYNHAAMLAYIEQCLNGIHGVVKDASTNQPIVGATITVQNHDALGSWVTSHEVGDFHRPIKGGTWTLVVSKSGYQSQTVSVTVADGQRQNIEVSLTPRDASEMVCYEEVTPTANGSYMMGSLHGNFLAMPTNNGTKITTTSLDVTVKDYGFKVEETSIPSLYSLTASGSQYYIKYGNYYLTRSSNKVTWSTSQNSSSGLWYVNANGIYQTSSGTNYYLVYNDGAFSISTINRNNITFYSERSCQPVEYTVTATANPTEGGTIDGAGPYLEDTSCTLTATANEDYQFIKWTENGEVVSTDNPYSFTVSSDRTLVAVFASTEPIDITVSASPARGGSVSGGGEFLFGETCTVTATANTGWAFDNWTENGIVVSIEPTYSFEVEEERNLVANFSYEATVSGDCYYTANSVSAGSFVMGYLDGTTLHALTNNNNSVAATTMNVIATAYGFSVDMGTTLPQITLTAYSNTGQYYIEYVYNNTTYYLTRSSMGGNLNWSTSSSSSGSRWYINSNGIYVTRTSTNYYLYYSNGLFALSTSQQNNITFYAEGDCPVVSTYNITATANPTEGGTVEGADIYYQGETCTLIATANEGYNFINWMEDGVEVSTDAEYSFEVTNDRALVANFEEIPVMVEQTVALSAGWNWWSTNLNIDLDQLKSALEAAVGGATVMIKAQNGNFLTYANGTWRGTLTSLNITKMYKIQTSAACEMILTGTIVDPEDYTITINHGNNWIGFPLSETISLDATFGTFPVLGDMIKYKTGSSATYTGNMWRGGLQNLVPGQGYIYQSASGDSRTFNFGTNSN